MVGKANGFESAGEADSVPDELERSTKRSQDESRAGAGYLNSFSASIGGASARVKLPSGRAAA
jgi:hypothetical protein